MIPYSGLFWTPFIQPDQFKRSAQSGGQLQSYHCASAAPKTFRADNQSSLQSVRNFRISNNNYYHQPPHHYFYIFWWSLIIIKPPVLRLVQLVLMPQFSKLCKLSDTDSYNPCVEYIYRQIHELIYRVFMGPNWPRCKTRHEASLLPVWTNTHSHKLMKGHVAIW